MMSNEKELIEAIRKELSTIGKFKTIHIPKNDKESYPERDATQACLSILQNSKAIKVLYKPTGTATIIHQKQEVSANIENELRNPASTQDLRQYMQRKYQWQDSAIDNIDWMIHGDALHTLPTRMKKTTIQFIHEWAPTLAHPGQQIHVNHKCPHCKNEDETLDDFLT